MAETSQTQEKAKEVAGQAQERVQDVAGQARSRVRDQVDERSTQAGEQVKTTASDVRTVADELRKQGKDTPARYAEQAADRAERLGGYLAEKDGDTILRDVEDYGRRNPWVVAAGGLALGFVASRFLKASSQTRYESSRSSGRTNGASYTPDPTGYGSSASGGVSPAVPAAPGLDGGNNPAL